MGMILCPGPCVISTVFLKSTIPRQFLIPFLTIGNFQNRISPMTTPFTILWMNINHAAKVAKPCKPGLVCAACVIVPVALVVTSVSWPEIFMPSFSPSRNGVLKVVKQVHMKTTASVTAEPRQVQVCFRRFRYNHEKY